MSGLAIPEQLFACTFVGSKAGETEPVEGVLKVRDSSMVFLVGDEEGRIFWSAILQEISNVKLAKKAPKLRLDTKSVSDASQCETATFTFRSAEDRDTLARTVTNSRQKNVVFESELAGTFPALSSVKRLRAAALSSDVTLQKLHNSVVLEQKILSDDEFWGTPERAALLEELRLGQQTTGMRSAHFLRELHNEKIVSSESEVYRFNAQLIADIFSEKPAVEEDFREHVIKRGVSEVKFWRDFLSSSHFGNRQQRGGRRDEQANIFDDSDARQIERERALKAEQLRNPLPISTAPPTLDIPLIDESDPSERQGYGTRKPSEWLGMGSNMSLNLQEKDSEQQASARYNQHSLKVLNALQTTPLSFEDLLDSTQEVSAQINPNTEPATKRRRLELSRKPLVPVPLPSAWKTSKERNLWQWAVPIAEDGKAAIKMMDVLANKAAEVTSLEGVVRAEAKLGAIKRGITEIVTQYWFKVAKDSPLSERAALHTHMCAQYRTLQETATAAKDPSTTHVCKQLSVLLTKAVEHHEATATRGGGGGGGGGQTLVVE